MAAISDCCGLGCNNCILDRFLDKCTRRPDYSELFNLFNQKHYQKFLLCELCKVTHNVYRFKFKYIRDEPFATDEQLLAPPLSYLMLRAPRDFTNSMETNSIFNEFLPQLEPPKQDLNAHRYFRSEPQRFDKGTPEIYFSRRYTPYELNEELRTFKLLVKLEPQGKMSQYFTRLHVGSTCEFKGPFEAYPYVHNQFDHYIVFTQGIGIVAAFRLVKEIVYENAETRILLISCFNDVQDIYLRDELFAMSSYWNLKHHIFLSNSTAENNVSRHGEHIYYHRLDEYNFKDLIYQKRYDPDHTQVLICGRESFVDYLKPIIINCRYKNVETI